MNDTSLPATIGRYRIKRLLGRGAMGVVYLALDDMIHRPVAIKTLRLDRLRSEGARQKAGECFLQEARIIGQLNHSHITAIYDMGIEQGLPYIVMEYVRGSNLKEIIAGGEAIPLREKLDILAMIARALHYAHQRGILHRDIKPANIMLVEERLPKITDFGIARVMNIATRRDESARPAEKRAPGTPYYMSPEQVQGLELDQRSDIFALGVLAYEWLSGRKPFVAASRDALLDAICCQTPMPLGMLCGIERQLETVVATALAKNPDDRFQSAAEMADSLELYIDHLEETETEGAAGRFSFDTRKIIDQLRQRYLFFADFTDQELVAIFKLCRRESFEKYEHLIRQGTSGTKMYIILSGSVAVVNEGGEQNVVLDELGEGSCVGEMAVLDRMPRSASVIAWKPTKALAINETVLRTANPRLCLKLYRNLAGIISERLRHSEAKYLELLDHCRRSAGEES